MKRRSLGGETQAPPSGVAQGVARARLVYEGPHYRIELLEDSKTILLVRSAQPFLSPSDVDAGCLPVQQVLDRLGRAKHNVLVDTRVAPANNDPEYEAWFAPHRRRMVQGFRRAACVIETAVGGLQTRRLVQSDGTPVVLFTSIEEALAYLEGDGTTPPPSSGSASGTRSSAPPGTGRRDVKE